MRKVWRDYCCFFEKWDPFHWRGNIFMLSIFSASWCQRCKQSQSDESLSVYIMYQQTLAEKKEIHRDLGYCDIAEILWSEKYK